MEQHPVPQPISSYQFRLVGDMTLRQFSQLAGGIVIALLIYSLPISSIFKWPLVFFFAFLGFAIAFLPLEDRPLDKWISAFFKSVYSPTQFVWKQQRKIPDFLKELPPKPVPKEAAVKLFPAAKAGLEEYLQTFTPAAVKTQVEKQETLALERIDALFKSVRLPSTLKARPKKKKAEPEESMPQMKIKPRKLVVPPVEQITLRPPLVSLSPKTPPPIPVVQPAVIPTPAPVTPKPTPTPPPPPPKKKVTVAAKLSTDLPIPTTPEKSNIITGMVLNPQGKIVENAILEIRNKDGLPVRALRTNQLGQFQIVTPLPNGTYEIEIDKEGFDFDIIKINLTGQIIKPIEIRSK